MSKSTLANAWSLDISPHPNAQAHIAHFSAPNPAHSATSASSDSSFNIWFLNNLLFHRWTNHHLALLIHDIPTSETRLHNEGLEPYYGFRRDLTNRLKGVAQRRGIVVPDFPDALANWKDELELDTEKLYGMLVPSMAEPTKKLVDTVKELMDPKRGYHWPSLVAIISVELDVNSDTIGVHSQPRAGDKTPKDETAALYKLTEHEVLLKAMDVLREEVLRIRIEGEAAGWREEEAKEVVTRYRGLAKDIWSLGTE